MAVPPLSPALADPCYWIHLTVGPRQRRASTMQTSCINQSIRTRQPGISPAGLSRTDWQTSCAILSGKAGLISQSNHHHQLQSPDSNNHLEATPTVPSSSESRFPTTNNSNKSFPPSLDLVPLSNLPRPLSLTVSDLSPSPTHGCQLRVAYRGAPGAYSEEAATEAYPNCTTVPCDQFDVAFRAVELWITDRAVLPVESSVGGSIHRNYDLLLRHRLHIVGEVQTQVHHCLLALPGVRRDQIKRVISHPQALAQCERTLTALGINVVRESFDDTAAAAEYVATNGLRDTAVIASAHAAELYGLQVLEDGIQDDPINVTRFLMLAREPVIPCLDRPFKTSIVFAHNKEGTSLLFKVLSAFAFRDIKLSKLESRPHRYSPIRLVDDTNFGTAKNFEYMFYLDFQASMADVKAQNALMEIQEYTSFLRVLGSYPMDMTPWSTSDSASSSSADNS
jgi:arogenate/prephenate dehydratase